MCVFILNPLSSLILITNKMLDRPGIMMNRTSIFVGGFSFAYNAFYLCYSLQSKKIMFGYAQCAAQRTQ